LVGGAAVAASGHSGRAVGCVCATTGGALVKRRSTGSQVRCLQAVQPCACPLGYTHCVKETGHVGQTRRSKPVKHLVLARVDPEVAHLDGPGGERVVTDLWRPRRQHLHERFEQV
jgi:hypothetical protein